MAKPKLTEIELSIKKYIPPEVNPAYQRSVSYSQYSMWATCPHRWAMKYIELGKQNELSERQKTVLNIYARFNTSNKHKMTTIPICKIPLELKYA